MYRRQGSRPSPRERTAKRQNDYLRRITLQIADKKKEKLKARRKRKLYPSECRVPKSSKER